MLGRLLWNKYGMVALGVIVLGLGFYFMGQTEPTCGGQTMTPGSVCDTTRKGKTTTTTYEEEKASQALMSKVMIGAGPVLIVGGTIWIVVSKRRKSAQAPVAAA